MSDQDPRCPAVSPFGRRCCLETGHPGEHRDAGAMAAWLEANPAPPALEPVIDDLHMHLAPWPELHGAEHVPAIDWTDKDRRFLRSLKIAAD